MSFAVTFGSVGDIIAVTQIVAQIIHALSDSTGSAVRYQQLLEELHSLTRALNHLDRLSSRSSNAPESIGTSRSAIGSSTNDAKPASEETLDSIKFAAAACRRPLEAFQKKIQKYKKALAGDAAKFDDDEDEESNATAAAAVMTKSLNKFDLKKKLGSATRKVEWEFAMKSEVQKLQNYLSLHVGTINMLLAEYGIDTMELESAATQASRDKMKELIEGTQKAVDRVSGNLDAQTAVIKSASSTVEKLLGTVTQWDVPWKMMSDMVSKIW